VGQVKPSNDERLTDRISVGVLTSTFPPVLVDEVLKATGRVEQRHRLLPARVVVYFTGSGTHLVMLVLRVLPVGSA
jgi:hypothetical protein